MEDDKSWVETTSKTPEDILLTLLLQKRELLSMAFDKYEKSSSKGNKGSTYDIRTRLLSLFRFIRSSMKEEKYAKMNELKLLLESKKIDDLYSAEELIDEWLYNKDVTKFDNINREYYGIPDLDAKEVFEE